MNGRNFYAILGVSPRESRENIRSAYRRRARELHPDLAGRPSTEAFRELSEAYETLSDPARRSAYDRTQRGPVSRRASRRDTGRSVDEPEMLVPEPLSLLRYPEGIRPSFEELYDRIARNFGGYPIPKSEAPEALNFELLLDPGEAARGGIVALSVPVMVRCPNCDGAGSIWLFACPLCDRRGRIEEQRTIAVRLPPAVRDGEIFEYSLREVGYRNLYLRLHLSVEG